jgi:plastocyanin
MKKNFITKAALFSVVCILSLGIKTSATIFTVNVANFSFSPATLPNVIIGDTIRWVWVSGFHTTTSTSVPAGAAEWDSPITETDTSFEYKVLVAGDYNYWCTPHQPEMAGSFTVSGSLPVKLSEFKIVNDNNKAVLKWITAFEENVDYFSIQKSKTGSDFTEIARVPATGHSSATKSYSYTDPISSSDKYHYYTIASVDKEGNKEFSSVELFKNNISTFKLIISISPNPIPRSGHLMLKFNADKKSKMDVKVINMDGRLIKNLQMQATEGVNNGHIMLDNIAAGSYLLNFELNGVKEVHRILVE